MSARETNHRFLAQTDANRSKGLVLEGLLLGDYIFIALCELIANAEFEKMVLAANFRDRSPFGRLCCVSNRTVCCDKPTTS